jgi:Tol biopolymer transport system component
LAPLREIAPVSRTPKPIHPSRGRWAEGGKIAAIFAGTIALVGAIALLVHRSPPAPSAPPATHEGVLTFISEGGIVEYVPRGHPHIRLLVRDRKIRGLGWSPDGRKLAYLSGGVTRGSSCSLQIVTFASPGTDRVSSSGPRFLNHSPCGPFSNDVAWSPNGSRVAYTLARPHSGDGYVGQQIVVVDVAARTRRVVAREKHGWGVTWWPGDRIASPCPSRSRANRWCSFTTDGSDKTQLHISGFDVRWSPTSGQVAYLRDPRSRLQVWTSAPSGARARLLVTQRKFLYGGMSPNLAWAPDGRQLIVTGADPQIINAETGQARQLDWHSPVASSTPAWRP